MKTIIRITALCSLLFIGQGATASDLSQSYTPSRAEWIEMALHKVVSEAVSPWELRTSVFTKYFPGENTIFVSVRASKGENPPTEVEKSGYVSFIRFHVDPVVKKYPWAKDVKVLVEFL